MTLPAWREKALRKSHGRLLVDCGDPAMNEFFRRYARQSYEQNASRTFYAQPRTGVYTVAPSSVAHEGVPASMTKGLARHEISGFKLARIATDVSVAGHGLGDQLLAVAALRCLRIASEAGGVLLTIDAKGERAARWCASYGARSLEGRPLTLVMPLAAFAADLKGRGLL